MEGGEAKESAICSSYLSKKLRWHFKNMFRASGAALRGFSKEEFIALSQSCLPSQRMVGSGDDNNFEGAAIYFASRI